MSQTRERYFELTLLGLILLIGYVLFEQVQPFINGALGAATLYLLLRRFNMYLATKVSETWAPWIIIFAVMIFVLIPVSALTWYVIDLVQNVDLDIQVIVKKLDATIKYLEKVTNLQLVSEKSISFLTAKITSVFNMLMSGVNNFAINLLTTLLLLFFMLSGGMKMERAIARCLPFNEENKSTITKNLSKIVRSNAIGIPLLAIIQGVVATVGYILCGVQNSIEFGALTGLASMIPIVGTMLVWIPLTIVMYFEQGILPALYLGLYGAIIISQCDNVLRMIMQKRMANTHPLITIFGVIAGLPLFGFMGLIFGPLLVAMFLLFLNLFMNQYIIGDKRTRNKKNIEQETYDVVKHKERKEVDYKKDHRKKVEYKERNERKGKESQDAHSQESRVPHFTANKFIARMSNHIKSNIVDTKDKAQENANTKNAEKDSAQNSKNNIFGKEKTKGESLERSTQKASIGTRSHNSSAQSSVQSSVQSSTQSSVQNSTQSSVQSSITTINSAKQYKEHDSESELEHKELKADSKDYKVTRRDFKQSKAHHKQQKRLGAMLRKQEEENLANSLHTDVAYPLDNNEVANINHTKLSQAVNNILHKQESKDVENDIRPNIELESNTTKEPKKESKAIKNDEPKLPRRVRNLRQKDSLDDMAGSKEHHKTRSHRHTNARTTREKSTGRNNLGRKLEHRPERQQMRKNHANNQSHLDYQVMRQQKEREDITPYLKTVVSHQFGGGYEPKRSQLKTQLVSMHTAKGTMVAETPRRRPSKRRPYH